MGIINLGEVRHYAGVLRDLFGADAPEAADRLLHGGVHDPDELDAMIDEAEKGFGRGVTMDEPARVPVAEDVERKSPCESALWRTDEAPRGTRIVVWDKRRALVHIGSYEDGVDEWEEAAVVFMAVETREEWSGEIVSREVEEMPEVSGLPWRPVMGATR